jgi:hypothetical protein
MSWELNVALGITIMHYCIEIWDTKVTSVLKFRMIKENEYAKMSLLMQNYIKFRARMLLHFS